MESSNGDNPLVTVVITAYNRPDCVNQAIESILAQTFTDYEINVADDCSSDEVVAQYRLPNCARLIRAEKRRGLAAAGRNDGIRVARGRYVALMDDDDIWLPEKLEEQVKLLESHPQAGLTYCHAIYVDENLSVIGRHPHCIVNHDPLDPIVRNCFICTPSCVMAPRDVFTDVGLFDESLECCCDWDMWIRIAAKYPFVADPECRIWYRKHRGQLSGNRWLRRVATIQIQEKVMTWAASEGRRIVITPRRRVTLGMGVLAMRLTEMDGIPRVERDAWRGWFFWRRVLRLAGLYCRRKVGVLVRCLTWR